MEEIHGAEYLLDGYATLRHKESFFKNEVRYTIQRYQGKHKNEFLLRSEYGDVYLFENNVLKQEWKEDKNGKKSEEFIRYKNGRADFSQKFEYILEQMNSKRIVYHKKRPSNGNLVSTDRAFAVSRRIQRKTNERRLGHRI